MEAVTHISAVPGLDGAEARRIATTQSEKMLSLLRDLSDEEWATETDCVGWSVHDVAAHLLGWAEAIVSPPKFVRQFVAARPLAKEKGNIVEAANYLQVEARRETSNRELLAELEVALPRMLKFRSNFARFVRYAPYYDGLLGATNVGYVMNVIFTRDTFMHRADITRPLRRDMNLGEDDRRLVEDVVRDWAKRSDAQVSLNLTGPAGGRYLTAAAPVADVTLDAVDFGRILTRREPPEIAEISGDREAALRSLSVFTPF
jgi:uncharacterized protein (TIGR03083 family)